MSTLLELLAEVKAAGGVKRVNRYELMSLCLTKDAIQREVDGGRGIDGSKFELALGEKVAATLRQVRLVCNWRACVWQTVYAI